MDNSFMDILRKEDESVDEPKVETIPQLLDRVADKNLKDTEVLIRILDIYSKNSNLSDSKMRPILRKFLDIFSDRINDITSLVRGLSKKSGFNKLRKKFGGRYFPAFARYTKDKDEKNESIIEIIKYNNKDADNLYLMLIREIPGLSTTGGGISEKKYTEVLSYVEDIVDNIMDFSESKDKLQEAIEVVKEKDTEKISESFEKIRNNMLNTFTEMAIEVSDFKDVAEDKGFDGLEDVIDMGYIGRESNIFDKLSGNLKFSVEYLEVAFSYVSRVVSILSDISIQEIGSDLQSLVADNPLIQVNIPDAEPEDTEPKVIDNKVLAMAKLTFSTMERLVDDIDGYTFKIPNDDDIVVDLEEDKLKEFTKTK